MLMQRLRWRILTSFHRHKSTVQKEACSECVDGDDTNVVLRMAVFKRPSFPVVINYEGWYITSINKF